LLILLTWWFYITHWEKNYRTWSIINRWLFTYLEPLDY